MQKKQHWQTRDIGSDKLKECCNKIIIFMVIYVLIGLWATELLAAVEAGLGNPDFVLTEMQTSLQGIGTTLRSYAWGLFLGLASLSLIMGIINQILSGEANLGSIAMLLARWIIYVGVFKLIMGRVGGYDYLPQIIVNSFRQLGEKVAGSQVMPGDILLNGLNTFGKIMDAASGYGMWQSIVAGFSGVILLMVYAFLATVLAVTLIEMYVVVCAGSILLGFAGFEFTKDIAFGYIRYAVSVGIKLLVIMIIAKVTKDMTGSWSEKLGAVSIVDFFQVLGYLISGVTTLALAAKMVPSIAQAAVSGSAIGGGSIFGVFKGAAAATAGMYKVATSKPVKTTTKTVSDWAKKQIKKLRNRATGGNGSGGGAKGTKKGGKRNKANGGSNYVNPPKKGKGGGRSSGKKGRSNYVNPPKSKPKKGKKK